ncbi:hypothetical protein [Nocardia tenerifensis]|uniref:hypothetical protein n=1 Tax=Nocardia tenerifensis TaxID=228006 RepID=UPI0002F88BFD|nr:hypothetical protein [Nocardia tenerifensis]
MDIDVLTKAVQGLRNAETVLTEAMNAMAKDGGNPDIGTTELDNAADSFQRRWHFGIERIGESASVAAEGVAACLDAYQKLDTAFTDILKTGAGAFDGQATQLPTSPEVVI